MAGGAAVTVATKSGTNNLHGTGWWFNNNQHFNSDGTYFRPVGYKKPVAILNIFGGNIGGPIVKDKLFYFFNFERTTERTGNSEPSPWPRPTSAPAISANGPACRWCTIRCRLRRTPIRSARVRGQHHPAESH